MTLLAKRKATAKPGSALKRKPTARKPRPTIEGLMRILERDLPPQDLLPENPVLVQRGSISV